MKKEKHTHYEAKFRSVIDTELNCRFELIEKEYMQIPGELISILKTLDTRDRRLLILYTEFESLRKVARIYNCSEGTIRHHLKSIKQKFQHLYKKDMNVSTHLLMMTTITVFIIDLSGIMTSIKKAIWKCCMPAGRPYENFSLKPFDCSLCTTWWTGLTYLLLSGNITIFNLLILSLCSFYSANITYLLIALQDLLGWITTIKLKK